MRTKAFFQRSLSEPLPKVRDLRRTSTHFILPINSNECDYRTAVDPSVIHLHSHFDNGPHLHEKRNAKCFRCVSGYDPNRTNRYYFTDEPTPVRVYLLYKEKPSVNFSLPELTTSKIDTCREKETFHQKESANASTNRTLSKASIEKLSVSEKFIDDAARMVYNPVCKSFAPCFAQIKFSIS